MRIPDRTATSPSRVSQLSQLLNRLVSGSFPTRQFEQYMNTDVSDPSIVLKCLPSVISRSLETFAYHICNLEGVPVFFYKTSRGYPVQNSRASRHPASKSPGPIEADSSVEPATRCLTIRAAARLPYCWPLFSHHRIYPSRSS